MTCVQPRGTRYLRGNPNFFSQRAGHRVRNAVEISFDFMKKIRMIAALSLVGALAAAAVVGWQKVGTLRGENEALRTELEALKSQNATATEAQSQKRNEELHRQQTQNEELARWRGEAAQSRSGTRDAERLRAENVQLRQQNQQLRMAGSGGATPVSDPAPASNDHFSKENWSFAGYATPESALVSAIWSMRDGNPKSYLESLSPDEQERMAKAWQNKSEAELAAKHQQDVSAITGLRLLDRQLVSPDETVMSVYIEGVNRMEKVSMKRVGNDWKFGGFIREPKK